MDVLITQARFSPSACQCTRRHPSKYDLIPQLEIYLPGNRLILDKCSDTLCRHVDLNVLDVDLNVLDLDHVCSLITGRKNVR